MSTSIVEKQEPHALVRQTAPATIMELVQLAIDKGIPVEQLKELVALHERVSDRAARQEFINALSEFQRVLPPIKKASTAKITTKGGGSYSYQYAELDDIQAAVQVPLHERGFSYSWDSVTEGKMLKAVCSLRHVNGHVEQASFMLPVDSASAMSEQQKYVAALSFAKRMSLTQVLGIRTSDADTDGVDPEPITEDQAVELEEMIETALADKTRFLQYMGVKSVREIRRSDANKAVAALEAKIKDHKRGRKVEV